MFYNDFNSWFVQATLAEVFKQAQAEFGAQGASLTTLREEMQRELAECRQYLAQTRSVLEGIYEGAKGESTVAPAGQSHAAPARQALTMLIRR